MPRNVRLAPDSQLKQLLHRYAMPVLVGYAGFAAEAAPAKIRDNQGDYSCLNASIGFRRAARRAGTKPNTTPTAAENTKAATLME